MKWRTGFDKAKLGLGQAYNTSMKVLSVTDRAHALLSKGFGVVETRLEPELRQRVGGALQTYGRRRQQLANVDSNVREIGSNLRQTFPEYLSS